MTFDFSLVISVPGAITAGCGLLCAGLSKAAGSMQENLQNCKSIKVEEATSTYARMLEERMVDRANGAKPRRTLVAVRGHTGAVSPISIPDKGIKAVMVEEFQEEVMMRKTPQGEWAKDVRRVNSNRSETPWYLHDLGQTGMRNGSRLPVVGGLNAAGEMPWIRTNEAFEKAEKGLAQHGMDYLTGLRVLGTRTVQNHVPVGAVVTVIGELAPMDPVMTPPDLQGHKFIKLVLKKPKGSPGLVITKKTLAELTAFYHGLHVAFKWTAVGLGVTGACLMLRKIWVGIQANRRLRRWREEEAARAEVASPSGTVAPMAPGQDEPNAPIVARHCAVCLDKLATHVWESCGHLCTCERCSQACGNKCPICRLRGRAIRVFVS